MTCCVSTQPSFSMKRHMNPRVSHVHTRRRITHTRGTLPHMQPRAHTWTLTWAHASFPSSATLVLETSSPPPLPSLPHPPPAPPLRKYSSGVPRAAQEMLCTQRVSQAIFCPRTGGRLGREQPDATQSAVFCLFFSASIVCSQCFSVSQWLCPVSVFLFQASGSF